MNVEAFIKLLQDAGSIPAASTKKIHLFWEMDFFLLYSYLLSLDLVLF